MKNKDILLKDNKNNNLYPLAHRDYNQHILDEFYFGANGALPTNTDLNDITKTGSYWLSSGNLYAHTPFDDGLISGNYGVLLIYKSNYSSDKVLVQEFIKVGSTKFYVYYRYKNSKGVWQSWLQSGGSGEVTDIQVNGTTILSNGIANFYINSAAGQYGSNNKIATMADIGAAGGGTVTNIAFSNTGGLSISGSPISTTGTISIGLTQLISSPPSDVALYPIKFGKYGRITSFSSAVTIPTKLTDLTNDGNFVQDSSYVHTNNNFTTTLKNKLEGIESNAQVNIIESISVNSVAQTITDKNINLVIPDATTVDSNFSTTSENPLQNKIITNNLNGRMMGYVPSNSNLNGLISAGVYYISEADSSGIAITTNADDSDLSASDKENPSLWPRPYPTFSVNLSDYPYWGYLIVEKISSNSSSDTNNQIKQTLWSIDSSNKKTGWACFFRIKLVNNKWTKWHKIADEDWPINSIQDSDIDHIMIDDLVSSLEG